MRKSSFELLSYHDPAQREKWRRIYHSFGDIDIFYHPEYCRLFELHGDGEPCLFVYYESPNDLLIYPFLKRSIKELSGFENLPEDYFDITSPYGYGGYLKHNNINMEKFYLIFHEFCKNNNIVTEFVRFNPLLKNSLYAPKNLDLEYNNETIIINLSDDEEKILIDMSSRCRNSIRKAQKNNIIIVNDVNYNEIDIFYKIYIDTMNKLRANKYYFFTKEWFYNLINLLKDNVALFHAYYENKIINSALFIFDKNYINYFLAGSLYDMRHLAANNLLLYEVSLWAKKKGLKYFHLGGGYQAADSLYRFKESFSPHKAQFYVGRIIHNKTKYEYFCNLKYEKEETKQDVNFFPIYRAQMNRVAIIGASGHARVCLEIFEQLGRQVIGLYDDDPNLIGSILNGYEIIGAISKILSFYGNDEIDYFIAIGNNNDRLNIVKILNKEFQKKSINAIHPSAVISNRVKIGHGNFIAAGVIINTGTVLGDYIIINTGATIDHDNIIKDYAQISPGCNLAGNVTVEENAFIGTGAVIIPGITIGSHAIIGAGAVVINDIPPFCTAVGVPARVIKQNYQTIL